MPFCYAPWTNLDISPQGDIAPCCKFRHEHYEPALNINQSSVREYKQSKTLTAVKEDFLRGNWPAGCERCKIEEENNIQSKRNLDYDRWSQYYSEYELDSEKFITASVAFGNTCNLKCITCNAHTSSLWFREYAKIYGPTAKPNHFYKKGLGNELVELAPELMHLDVPGGEPFLSGIDEQLGMLEQWVKSGQAQHMSLHYTTNAMIFPEEKWWDIWQNFKNVDIQISIDGVGEKAEYIRYPCDWKTISTNVDKYVKIKHNSGNLQLSTSHTVSAYNIFYLDEFFIWCQDAGLTRPWLGRVHNPVYMRPSVWPDQAKKIIVQRLRSSKDKDVLTWAELMNNLDDSAYFDEFKLRTAQHDEYRNLDFAKTFPEMAEWMS